MRRHFRRYFGKPYLIPVVVFILWLIALMVWMLNPPETVRTSPVSSSSNMPISIAMRRVCWFCYPGQLAAVNHPDQMQSYTYRHAHGRTLMGQVRDGSCMFLPPLPGRLPYGRMPLLLSRHRGAARLLGNSLGTIQSASGWRVA